MSKVAESTKSVKSKTRANQKSFQSVEPKSLNIVYRMNELKRIEHENHKIAKHLYYNKGNMDH